MKQPRKSLRQTTDNSNLQFHTCKQFIIMTECVDTKCCRACSLSERISIHSIHLLRTFQDLIFHSVPPFDYRQSMNWLCLLLLVISMFHLFSRRVDVDLDRPRPRRGRDRILSIGDRHELVVCGNWLDALKDAAGLRCLDC